MFTRSRRTQHQPHDGTPAPRRGVALVFVLIFVVAMAALAMSSIFLASNANQLDTAILLNQTLTGANGQPMAGITVNVYVGPTGSTSGQFGRFSSIVAEARDQRGNGFIRRLELTQESFAKFAYWSNAENLASGGTIFFNNGDVIWGPVWSNDTINIGSGGATFHDEVGTVFFINGISYGVFSKGYLQHQKPISLPSTTQLNNLKAIAQSSGWKFTSGRAGSNTETSVLDRIEFVATDLNASGDSTDLNEGLFKVYTARSDAALRGDYPGGSPPSVSNVNWCGDWHWTRVNNVAGTAQLQFYPASRHNTPWFDRLLKQGFIDSGFTASQAQAKADSEMTANLQRIMQHANARCYLPGDNHLVAVERSASYTDPRTGSAYDTLAIYKGGMDTTFTPTGVYGSWLRDTFPVPTAVSTARPRDAAYLFEIDRMFNTTSKGVIHFTGNVGVSGTLNGRITLYAAGTIILLDDIRYANDPVKGVCRDILGLIADKDIVIADNAINTPQLITSSLYDMMDDTKDIDIHAVMMAMGTSFRVENYNTAPTALNNCGSTVNGRGCINLSGGIIQLNRGPVGQSNGTGFSKRYTYDHCAVVNPPPYFPTTGRFQDNRYLELDPAGFNHTRYFQSLTP